MATLIGTGPIGLKLFDTDGTTTLKTLYLPEPDRSGIDVNWDDLGVTKRSIDGRTYKVYSNPNKRYIPKLTIK